MQKSVLCFINILLTIASYTVNGENTEPRFREDYQWQPELKAFYKVHQFPMTWFEARTRCQREGAELVVPESQKEVHILKEILNNLDTKDQSFYLGIHSLFSAGRFVTLHNTEVKNINLPWEIDQPNNYKNDGKCVALNCDGKLFDTNCNNEYAYVCKKAAKDISWNTDCNTYDQEYKLNRFSCYKIHTIPKNWTSAYDVCQSEGGHLVIINSIEERDFLVKLLTSLKEGIDKKIINIGFHALLDKKHFRTIEGQTLQQAGYSEWGFGEPDNEYPGQECGSMFPSGKINDSNCSGEYIFICERPK